MSESINNFGFSPRKSLLALSVISVLGLASAPTVAADAFNGVVKGVITSANNQVASDATVTLTHKTKNITRTIKTNE